MDPIDEALLAVMATMAGNTTAAQHHLDKARHGSTVAVRRQRQLIEIAGHVVAGTYERADGLALVHAAEYPDDAELVDRVTHLIPLDAAEA
jgi:hypothetical protein